MFILLTVGGLLAVESPIGSKAAIDIAVNMEANLFALMILSGDSPPRKCSERLKTFISAFLSSKT